MGERQYRFPVADAALAYLDCLNDEQSCHQPDTADYGRILSDYNICDRVKDGQVDELWLFGGPWFGYYESRLAGPGAFWYNSPPLNGTNCDRLLPIMGFNYERGVAEMLHDLVETTPELARLSLIIINAEVSNAVILRS